MKVTIFGGIKNIRSISMAKYEACFLEAMQKYHRDIAFEEYSISAVNTFFLKGLINRYFLYMLRSRRHCSEINHILDHPNACILNFFPKGVRSIVICHDLVPMLSPKFTLADWPFRFFSARGLKKADRIIAVSKNTRDDLVKLLKISEDRISIIYSGIDHDVFMQRDTYGSRKKLGLPAEQNIILHVGSEEPRKNIESLIIAFSKLQKEIHNIVLIRVGRKSKKVSDLIAELKLQTKVVYLRDLDESNLALLYNAADVFVFPSLYEGFGAPVVEAMASGTPVVTSNKSSLPEVVGDAAIMVEPEDTDALSAALCNVLTDSKLRESMIAKGLIQAKAFSWERVVRETRKVYEELA